MIDGNSSVIVNAIKLRYDKVKPEGKTELFKKLWSATEDSTVTRFIQIGGAGSLKTADGSRLYSLDRFPRKAYNLGLSHTRLRSYLEKSKKCLLVTNI